MRIGLIKSGKILAPGGPNDSPDKELKRIELVVSALAKATVIGLDIETGFIGPSPRDSTGAIDYSGLSPETGEIKSIQVCVPNLVISGQIAVVMLTGEECRSGPILDALLSYVQQKGKWTAIHNALYEGEWFLAKFGTLILNPFCTLVGNQMDSAGLAYSIEAKYKHGEKKVGANSLQTAVERKLGLVISKEMQTSDWAGPLTDEQCRYAMLDAYLAWRLFEKFRYLLESRAGRAEMGCIPMFIYLNRQGMPASLPKLKELSEGYTAAIEGRERLLREAVDEHLSQHPELKAALMPKTLSKKKRAQWVFNLGSPQQVLKLLNSMLADRGRDAIGKTDASTLERVDLPFARQLSEYRSLVKLLGYVNVFIKNYRHSSGTVMCKYSVLAYKAAAGRSSASNGSLQIVGNTSPVLAREGLGGPKTAFAHSRREHGNDEQHVAMKCDLPASHLQLVAALTSDELLVYCLSNDEKVHYHTLARMLQLMGVRTSFEQVKAWFTQPNHGGVTFVMPDGRVLTDAEVKSLYTLAKNVIYSFINFAGAVSLQNTFLKKGIRTTVEECKMFLQACKDMYLRVYGFQRTIARQSERELRAIWDAPPSGHEEASHIASIFGAVPSERGVQFLTKAVRKQMPDGRWLHFPGFAQRVIEETEDIVDTADDVQWACRPADIIAAHWLSTEATIMKRVAARLMEAFREHPEWQASIRAFAHDEVVLWVLARYIPEISQLYMELVTEEFREFVPFFIAEPPTVMENWEKPYSPS